MKKILIVDDDKVLLKLMTDALKDFENEFTVFTAENGVEAKTVLEQEEIALVITDIVMPEMDGLALLAYVNEHFYGTPCFAMTAYATPDIKKLIPKDVLRFYSKPFKLNLLGEEIKKVLEKGEMPTGTISGISVASFLRIVDRLFF